MDPNTVWEAKTGSLGIVSYDQQQPQYRAYSIDSMNDTVSYIIVPYSIS